MQEILMRTEIKSPEYYNEMAIDATNCKCCKTCIVKMCCTEICSNWVNEQLERLAEDNNVSVGNIKNQIINYGIQHNISIK